MMAVVGVWLWSSPAHFERSQDQKKLIPVDLTRHPFECTSVTLLGLDIPIQSPGLRAWSLLVYSLLLAPIFNLAAPALLFLALYIKSYQFNGLWYITWSRQCWRITLPKESGVIGVTVGLIFLLIMNIVFLVDNELTIHRAIYQQEGESQWTFGQTLALLLLSLPLRDTAMLELYRRDAGRRSLFAAVREDDEIKVEKILKHLTFNIDSMDEDGSTPLNIALTSDSDKVAQLLLEHGADAKAANNDGWTPLHFAADQDSEKVTRLLLEHGADTKTANNDGWTPLHTAVRWDSEKVARLLLEHGADAKAANNGGWTPLHFAADQDSDKVAQLLLEHGADAKAANNDGWTPLHFAVVRDSEKVARLLLKHGADAKSANKDGWTPLHNAVMWDSEKVAQLLLEHGVDENVVENDGLTPLDIAVKWNSEKVARLLNQGVDARL
jgi:ankyrin repeat protein